MSAPLNVAVFGAGFIGKNLINRLAESKVRIKVLDRNVCPKEFIGITEWLTGEFSDKENLRNTLDGVDIAFHLISSTVPGDDAADPIKELSDNIFSTIKFLDMCSEKDVKRVVFVSSSSVYGLQDKTPIPENAVTNPISSHGIQKLTIEKYFLLHQFLHNIDVRIARVSNPYGPGQDLYGRQGFIAMAIGKMINNEPILLRDAGRPVRDFVYIDNVTKVLALFGTTENVPSILNIGSGVGYSIKQVVELLEEIVGEGIETVPGPSRKVDIPTSVLDVSLENMSLGLDKHYSLRDGLIRTLEFHKMITA